MSLIIDGQLENIIAMQANIETMLDQAEKAVVTGEQVLTGGSIANIFQIISPGPIAVTSLIGHITEAVSANACDLKLVMDPSAGIDTDMCAVLDINGFVLDSWIYLDGVIANAAVQAISGTALPRAMDIPLILPRGTIDLDLSNSDPTTGAIVWYLKYIPLNTGITVTGIA